jgi:hypothetical protein
MQEGLAKQEIFTCQKLSTLITSYFQNGVIKNPGDNCWDSAQSAESYSSQVNTILGIDSPQ